MSKTLSVAITAELNQALLSHLLRADGQEDLCFVLWNPSYGTERTTALLSKQILPNNGERTIHGNASFEPEYFERVLDLALKQAVGIAFIHSHVGPGWQGMSPDDIEAENRMAKTVKAVTGLPLVGLTASTNGIWSARFWEAGERSWCETVRVVGKELKMSYDDSQLPVPPFKQEQLRTTNAWGDKKHADLSRLHIGIVGAGSVGEMVAESLARIGIKKLTAVDFDNLELKNLDRSLHAKRQDVGKAKVDVLARSLKENATADNFSVRTLQSSIIEEDGYRAILDCDIIFSCVDRPWPRHVLNHIAYAHMIPVIDGGIRVETLSDNSALRNAYWSAHTVGIGHTCLACIGQLEASEVTLEQQGLLDDPVYIQGIPKSHLASHENVFAFSMATASAELMHLISMVTMAPGVGGLEPQRFALKGAPSETLGYVCSSNCYYQEIIGKGETAPIQILEVHELAQKARNKTVKPSLGKRILNRLLSLLRTG